MHRVLAFCWPEGIMHFELSQPDRCQLLRHLWDDIGGRRSSLLMAAPSGCCVPSGLLFCSSFFAYCTQGAIELSQKSCLCWVSLLSTRWVPVSSAWASVTRCFGTHQLIIRLLDNLYWSRVWWAHCPTLSNYCNVTRVTRWRSQVRFHFR